MLVRDPTNVQALLNLAHVDTMLHHYTHALESLEAVLAIEPNHSEALYLSGQLLYQRQHYREAVRALTRLSHIEPNYRDSSALLQKARNRTMYSTLLP